MGGSSIDRVGHGTAPWADLGLKGMPHAAARILVIALSLQIGPKIMNLHGVLGERQSGTKRNPCERSGPVRQGAICARITPKESRSLIR